MVLKKHIKSAFIMFCCFAFLCPCRVFAGDSQGNGAIADEFNKHPTGYTLVGVGGVLGFLGFGGLFAGGDSRNCAEKKTQEHYNEDTEEGCKSKRAKANGRFYSAMAVTLGAGLVTAGIGVAVIKWGGEDSEVALGLNSEASPTLVLNLRLH